VEPDGFVFALSNGGPLRTANFRMRVWRLAMPSGRDVDQMWTRSEASAAGPKTVTL
jgi:hypothetical protein